MTNTHITIGGHKVTTNKVGQVHTITSFDSTYTNSFLSWVVVNRICYVFARFRRNATGTDLTPYNGLPKSKIGSQSVSLQTRGYGLIQSGANVLYLTIQTANADCYINLVYPVADDWVES